MNPSDNNSFGMQSVSGGQGVAPMMQTVRPRDTGDIVLPTSGKKTKKWPFVVVGVVILVALTVAGALMMRGGGGGSSGGGAENKFNSFANYILYGNEFSEDISGDYDSDASYVINNIMIGDDASARRSYFDDAANLWDNFVTDFSENDLYNDEKYAVRDYINLISLNLGFLVEYARFEEPTQEMAINQYLKDGENSAKQFIEKSYQNFAESGNALMQEYADYGKAYLQITLDQLDAIDEAGCIKDGAIDDACVSENGVTLASDYWETHETPMWLMGAKRNIINDSIESIIQYCFVLDAEIKNPTEKLDEVDDEE